MARIFLGFLSFLIALFCVYGFLASFEHTGVTRWKIGYALAILAFGTLSLQLVAKGIRKSKNSTESSGG